jgi:cell wall-associated NlpC family hydrolase
MKNQTVLNQSFKLLFSLFCCFFLILTSTTVHGRQIPSKPDQTKKPAGQKVAAKTTEKKSGPSRQNKNSNPKLSAKAQSKQAQSKPGKLKKPQSQKIAAKTAAKKSSQSQLKRNPCPKLSAKNTGKKSKTKQTLSKKKSPQKMTASIASAPMRSPFQYSPSDFSEMELQEEMKGYIGIPYRSGGTSLQGMDCSGFARTIYANLFGIQLPHNSAAQFSFPKLQNIDEDELKTGDLVFFSRKKRINHVGVYLGDGNFIHATNGNGIMISSLDDQHWKTRMVGTKRPMSFDKTGMDTLRLDGGFDISLNTGNQIKSHARDEFRPSYDFDNSIRPHAFREPNDEVYDFNNGHLYSYEVEFRHKLWDDTCNVSMSAIREKLDKASAWNVYDRELDADWPLHKQSLNDSSSTVRHGFKLASEITPFEGVSITPSFIYLNYDQQQTKEMLEVPKRIFGLSTQITPMAGPWSVSMAMHYADQLDMADSLFKTSDLLNTMDMSLKLGYYFSKNLELSIMGIHDFKAIPGRTDTTTSLDSSISSDFLFKLDMKY